MFLPTYIWQIWCWLHGSSLRSSWYGVADIVWVHVSHWATGEGSELVLLQSMQLAILSKPLLPTESSFLESSTLQFAKVFLLLNPTLQIPVVNLSLHVHWTVLFLVSVWGTGYYFGAGTWHMTDYVWEQTQDQAWRVESKYDCTLEHKQLSQNRE